MHNQEEADGFTYFGCFPEAGESEIIELVNIEQSEAKPTVANDFLVPLKKEYAPDAQRGRQFQIWFYANPEAYGQSKSLQGYYIRDLGKAGFGVFRRIQSPCLQLSRPGREVLKDNMLINIGDTYLVVQLPPDSESANNRLVLKLFGSSPEAKGEFMFDVEQMEKCTRRLKVGRGKDCDIRVRDKTISKVQFHIIVEKKAASAFEWVLVDGLDGRPSTNGTWVYINKDTLMHDGMIIKANQTVFQVRLK